MRKRSIGCDILIGLLDCKLHTIQELAERAEVSYMDEIHAVVRA